MFQLKPPERDPSCQCVSSHGVPGSSVAALSHLKQEMGMGHVVPEQDEGSGTWGGRTINNTCHIPFRARGKHSRTLGHSHQQQLGVLLFTHTGNLKMIKGTRFNISQCH